MVRPVSIKVCKRWILAFIALLCLLLCIAMLTGKLQTVKDVISQAESVPRSIRQFAGPSSAVSPGSTYTSTTPTGKAQAAKITQQVKNEGFPTTGGFSLCRAFPDHPTIYFLETAGLCMLNPRQACSIESAARANTKNNVTVFLLGEHLPEFNSWMSNLAEFGNVHLEHRTLDDMFLGSPLENFYKKGLWKLSPFRVSHLSDALRFLVIWKYGGIYLDLDFSVLRPLDGCLYNSVVPEHSASINAAIMGFSKGSPYLRQCLADFDSNYEPYKWASNGPELATRNYFTYCSQKKPCDVTVLPVNIGYPVPYWVWRDLFKQTSVVDPRGFFNESLAVHISNKLSSETPIPQDSLYDVLMIETCPNIYSHVIKHTQQKLIN